MDIHHDKNHGTSVRTHRSQLENYLELKLVYQQAKNNANKKNCILFLAAYEYDGGTRYKKP